MTILVEPDLLWYYIVHLLSITSLDSTLPQMTHEVVQYQFLGWPELAEEEKKAARSLLPLIADVKKEMDAANEFAILVHCMLV